MKLVSVAIICLFLGVTLAKLNPLLAKGQHKFGIFNPEDAKKLALHDARVACDSVYLDDYLFWTKKSVDHTIHG